MGEVFFFSFEILNSKSVPLPALATRPLSPPDQSDGKLSSLTFVSAPSEGAEEKGKLYLAATYLDFEDCEHFLFLNCSCLIFYSSHNHTDIATRSFLVESSAPFCRHGSFMG